ncbi:spore gernimation protein [Photobacterium nomapromontoriensis]|uniref:spore gernimation protein n=1 Tax=Photobacterium nomapromontoriensis TaxID=2910237 RepID=UPI003D10BA85
MKRVLIVASLGFSLFLLSGCGEKAQLVTTPVKNVDAIEHQQDQLDVYCPTGICQFDLSANQDTDLTINMHYSQSRPFEKIEGVSVTGRTGSSAKVIDGNTFEITLDGNVKPARIQIVDYYRN